MNVTLNVTFDEAFNGTEKRVTVRIPGKDESDTSHGEGARRRRRMAAALRFKGKGGSWRKRRRGRATCSSPLRSTRIRTSRERRRRARLICRSLWRRRRSGASIVVPAPDGTKVRVKVPAGTQDGTVLTIKGKGAPRVQGAGLGDLKIKVHR